MPDSQNDRSTTKAQTPIEKTISDLITGPPKNIRDPRLFHSLSLVAFLAFLSGFSERFARDTILGIGTAVTPATSAADSTTADAQAGAQAPGAAPAPQPG